MTSRNNPGIAGRVVLLVGNDTTAVRELAILLARRGADIALVYNQISSPALQRIGHQVRSLGGRFLSIDALEWPAGSAKGMVEAIVRHLGHIDLYVDLSAQHHKLSQLNNFHEWDASRPDYEQSQALLGEMLFHSA